MLPFYMRDTDPPAKREILRAAMKPFGQHGLAGTTIRDIAKERGYTNPALYEHFVIAAASLQGTLAESARMIQVGVVRGPALSWKGELVKLVRKSAAA